MQVHVCTDDGAKVANLGIWSTTPGEYHWSVTDGTDLRLSKIPVRHRADDGLLVLLTNVLKAACGSDCDNHPNSPEHDVGARWTLESLYERQDG